MNILQRIARGLFGVTFGTPGAETWQYSQDWIRGLPVSMTNPEKLERPFEQHITIGGALSTVAEDAASVDWELFPARGDDEDDPVEDHPLFRVLNKPNAIMTGRQIWVASYLSYLWWGEAVWYYPNLTLQRRNAPGVFDRMAAGGIELLLPDNLKARMLDTGEVEWKYKLPGGTEAVLDSDRLTVVKRWNPERPMRGCGLREALVPEAEGDFAAARWNQNFFGEGNGIPAGLLKPTDASLPMTLDKQKDFERRWSEKHGGVKRRVGLMPRGYEWVDLSMSQREMDFKVLREYAREQLLALIGLPPFRAGVLDKANYANSRQQDEVYWNGRIRRLLTIFQETLNADFLPKIGVTDAELYPKWEIVASMLEDFEQKSRIAKTLFDMGFPKDQINQRLELGFDTSALEDESVGYLPATYVPVSDVLNPPEPVAPVIPPGNAPDAPPEGDADGEEAPADDAEKAALPHPKRLDTEVKRAARWRDVIARTRDLETTFERLVRRHFKQLQEESLRNLNGFKTWQARQTKEQAIGLFDAEKADLEIRRVTAQVYRQTMRRAGDSVMAEIGVGISFRLEDPRAVSMLMQLSHKIVGINATVESQLRETLAEGLAGSETIDKLRDRITQVFDASLGRARMIARTEIGNAFNGGRYVAMKEAGIQYQEWLSSRDPDVRESHAEVDGERIALEATFSNGLRYPQDPGGPPGEVINCRCVAIPVVEPGA